ncbi:cob(I)yrinic acid a,c-diamide adenosyltransferase [Marinilabiliaceae bacterium JC040]|nr:cob(I)yrinic acid a,c-diamide adenosyltransferase [Marinilabiliaceae bacterium JC040]
MRVYTKGGDKGMTGIHGGERVPKDDIRIEANGCLDELNSNIGMLRSMLGDKHNWQENLHYIQTSLMIVMSHVATPSDIRFKNPNVLNKDLDTFCEKWIDELENKIQHKSEYFILPGGNNISSQCHIIRTIARRAERRLCTLNKKDNLPDIILKFTNRLSDLFFILARAEMDRIGKDEDKWKSFLYKKKKSK